MQSLIGNTNLNLDIPGEIINNFNQTYSQINELKFKNDERKRKEIEDDLLEQAKYFIQVGRDLIKQGVPASKVPWAFKSPRTVMDGLKQNYDSYKQTIDTENQNLAWNNFINKYAGAGEFNRQEWEQDPISVEKRLLENKVKKGEINSSEIDEALYGGNQTKTKTQTPQTQNTPKVAPSQTQTNITGAAPADSNIEKTIKDENDINLMINDLKIKQENLLEISKKLGEKGLGSGKQADFISNKLSDLQNKIIELQLYDINQKQKIELNQLKQNTATAIEKIEQKYNFKLLEKEVLNRQKLEEIKSGKEKTNYQAQIDTLQNQFNNAKTKKEKSEISEKMKKIEVEAKGKNINVNLPENTNYEPFDNITAIKEGDNYKIKIDGVEIPNILIKNDGTKIDLKKYGINAWWDKNANNGKGQMKFEKYYVKNKNQIKKGKVGNINYSIEKQ